jgi:predicted Rossmann fold flavoprotein
VEGSPQVKVALDVSQKKIIVIGGGPAGLMAAGIAAQKGCDVMLLEKMTTCGRKLSITGKGRCNLTNIAPLRQFIPKFGKNGKFLHQAFDRFFSEELAEFLKDIGVDIKVERGGRVFPEGENAPAVTEALITWVKSCGVKILNNCAVDRLIVNQSRVRGVIVGKEKLLADAVIVATGGLSYPATGSTGDGYTLLTAVGHTLVETRPSLVPLITSGPIAKQLQGLAVKNVSVRLIVDGKRQKRSLMGEMLFTHFGLSGPIVLTISHDVVDLLADNHAVSVAIDLKPALDEQKLDSRLQRELQEQSNRQFATMLKSLLPSKLIPACCDLVSVAPDKLCNQVTTQERRRLCVWLKDFSFEVTGHRSYAEAIVTAGGIDLKEINPRSMESNLIGGLYICGELLDIDGETGGYNLQAAFSTGFLAGDSATEHS